MASSFLLLILCVALAAGSKEPVKIKIVDSPALSRFPAMPSHEAKKLTLRAKPSPLSGPPHLQQLNGECFTAKDKGYTYNVCPFNNITQKEDRIGWNSFHGVLGVWHEWVLENDTFTGMHYTLGDHCGSTDRDAMVFLNCSASTRIHNFTEPRTCSYHMVLDTPLACFKGAMQIYHVLTDKELKEWDQIDQHYHADEITHKGRSKQRQELLVRAGILQELKKVEVTQAPSSEVHHQTSSSELTQCLKDKEALQKEIQEIKKKVLKVVQNYPELHLKIGLVLNSSSNSSSEAAHSPPQEVAHSPSQQVARQQQDSKKYSDESLLSDKAMDTLAKDMQDNLPVPEGVRQSDERVNNDEGLDALLQNMDINNL